MKVIHGIKNLKKQAEASAIAVGVFDGVHTGHQKILKELLRRASFLKAKPTVVTFRPHPEKILKGASSVVTLASLKHRLRLFEKLGVEACLVVRFNKAVARLSAGRFIQDVLINKLNMKALIAGEDFSFGRDRVEKKEELNRIAEDLNFKLIFIKPKKYQSRTISSSLIRHLIERGRLNLAAMLLGRPVSILGTVVKGRRRGRTIGFKTANIDPHHEAIPPSGVYAVYSRLGQKFYKAVLNIGTRPTFGEKEPTIEAHIFGINRNLYGNEIEIYFKKRLRPERRFKNKDRLRQQIAKDVVYAKKIL